MASQGSQSKRYTNITIFYKKKIIVNASNKGWQLTPKSRFNLRYSWSLDSTPLSVCSAELECQNISHIIHTSILPHACHACVFYTLLLLNRIYHTSHSQMVLVTHSAAFCEPTLQSDLGKCDHTWSISCPWCVFRHASASITWKQKSMHSACTQPFSFYGDWPDDCQVCVCC